MANKKKITNEEVKHIAKLANLSLSIKEITQLQDQLSETLDYIEILNHIKTHQVEPTSQVTGLVNVTRKDEVLPSLPVQEALKNAPKTSEGFIKIEAIFENE